MQNELKLILLGHPIFITSHVLDGGIASDLRNNERYWDFEHVIFLLMN
jgi:hypothetical protein